MRPARRAATAIAAIVVAALAATQCTATSLLGPDADQGIDGRVLLGPQCPAVREDDPCPDQPYETSIALQDASGGFVTRVESDIEGRFHVGLRPGDYVLTPNSKAPFPRAMPVEVTVEPDQWLAVVMHYDTGIR